MGYTTSQSELLLGLGTSSISNAKYAYAQNLKETSLFQAQINSGSLAVFKGHIQSTEDLLLHRAILDVACLGHLDITPELREILPENAFKLWGDMKQEGIITLTDERLELTPDLGKMFLRNVCAVLDKRMFMKKKDGKPSLFSKSI